VPQPFTIAFVPGVTPDKWARIWRERERIPLELKPVEDADQLAVLDDGRADMCLLRLPVDRDDLHLVRLYEERPVVVVPRDHPVAAYDEVALADLAGEQLVTDPAEVPGWEALDAPERLPWPQMRAKDAVEVVASGAAVAIMPMSLARLHHRKDVTYREVTDGPVSAVGLAWLRDADDERCQAFVGIARGRTVNSSRGR
jgi:DNA-binding transcriptional LysR family regulator